MSRGAQRSIGFDDLSNQLDRASCCSLGIAERLLDLRRFRQLMHEISISVVQQPIMLYVGVIRLDVIPEGLSRIEGLMDSNRRVSKVVQLREQGAELGRSRQPSGDYLVVCGEPIEFGFGVMNVVPKQFELRNNQISVAPCAFLLLLPTGPFCATASEVGENNCSNCTNSLNPSRPHLRLPAGPVEVETELVHRSPCERRKE